ncbi:unnamed protein product, partial [marine sediment metagenome]
IIASDAVDGIEISGDCTNGIHASGVIPTILSVQDVGDDASHIIDVKDAYLGMVIETGTYGTEDTGVTLTSSNVKPASFLFDDSDATLGGGSYRPLLSRVYLAHTQSGESIALRSIRGQLTCADLVNFDIESGQWNMINAVEGYIQLLGTHVIGLNTRLACVHATLEVATSLTVTSGGYVAGVFAENAMTTDSSQTAGWPVAFLADTLDSQHTATQEPWATGLFLVGGGCKTAIKAGTSTAKMV